MLFIPAGKGTRSDTNNMVILLSKLEDIIDSEQGVKIPIRLQW